MARKSSAEAWEELREAARPIWQQIERALLPVVAWIDRQLRRSPRLYRRLGGDDVR